MGKEIKTILSRKQKKIFELIGQDMFICKNFYLSGGTALAEFYLQHRLSEDLDFFSEKEFDPQAILVFFKKNRKEIGFQKIDFKRSFNRNLFFLYFGKEVIKTEFTFFPFSRIEKKKKEGGLFIDSLLDIAVNKIFTIYQNPRSRDFIDLFVILRNTGWKIDKLVKQAKIKFDWHVDYLELGAKFLLVKRIKDYPRMIEKIKAREWQEFFLAEAKKIKQKIIEY